MSHPIPTNVITGFLGSGKTTAIVELLRLKPVDERWAVLINEFGEIGIDAGLIHGLAADPGQVQIKEVAGGCMCCTAGLPMQVALNQLIRQSRPDRLLIEPTGLGHPKEVLATLQAQNYADVLDVRATLTLVDARKIADPRYTSHSIFQQQVQVADVLIASKSDLYGETALQQLHDYVSQQRKDAIELVLADHGRFPLSWLDRPRQQQQGSRLSTEDIFTMTDRLPVNGILTRGHQDSSGYHSFGWIFDRRYQFDYESLYSLLIALDVARLKAVMNTNKGTVAFNMSDDVLSVSTIVNEVDDSRIECLLTDQTDLSTLETELRSCLVNS